MLLNPENNVQIEEQGLRKINSISMCIKLHRRTSACTWMYTHAREL